MARYSYIFGSFGTTIYGGNSDHAVKEYIIYHTFIYVAVHIYLDAEPIGDCLCKGGERVGFFPLCRGIVPPSLCRFFHLP